MPEAAPTPALADRRSRVLAGAIGTVLIVELIGLMWPEVSLDPQAEWLGPLAQCLPALLCWSARSTAGARRLEVTVMAIALTLYGAGTIVFVIAAHRDVASAFPSVADVGFLAFYPLALAAIVIAARREMRSAGMPVWLDSLLGGLGAATVLSLVLDRVFIQATGGSLAGGLALIYPILDLLLVSAVVGIASMLGRRTTRSWLALLAGFAVLAGVDALAALPFANGSYTAGGPIDVLWPIGLALLGPWAYAPPVLAVPPGSVLSESVPSGSSGRENAAVSMAHAGPAMHPLPALPAPLLPAPTTPADLAPKPQSSEAVPVAPEAEPVALVVPAVAAIAVLAVLVASVRSQVSTVTLILAILSLVATAGRTQVAFSQLVRLADLRRLASTDELTGLRNRRSFYQLADEGLAASTGTQALLLLDLDRFKEVNDSLGHQVGDELLCEIGHRLGAQLGTIGLLARLGGDEFAVLLNDTTHEQALELAARLRAAVAQPCTLEGITVRTDVSIGVSFAPEHATELSGLLRCADIAMYEAKRAREGLRIYAGTDAGAGMSRLRAIQELHVALAEDQLVLHYQPKLDLKTDQVHHVEALIRWDHPTRGLLYPDSFLSLVEDAGLMGDLTHLVLVQALDQAVAWQQAGRPLNVAVNLSANALIDAALPGRVKSLLTERKLPANRLQLEITEDFLMTDRDRARDVLMRLREQNIQISVDDFGTGYSSLAYLRELPVDELKLDKSFVFPMADDVRAAALVFSTIALAHSLGLRMVAEGVENQAALTELARHGCDQAQGYFISRPLPPVELGLWLDRREQARPEPHLAPVDAARR